MWSYLELQRLVDCSFARKTVCSLLLFFVIYEDLSDFGQRNQSGDEMRTFNNCFLQTKIATD